MSGTINNGRRVVVDFGPYSGEAGVQDLDNGQMEVAFMRSRAKFPKDVADGTVGGVACRVTGSRSATVPGMVVLIVTAVTADS